MTQHSIRLHSLFIWAAPPMKRWNRTYKRPDALVEFVQCTATICFSFLLFCSQSNLVKGHANRTSMKAVVFMMLQGVSTIFAANRMLCAIWPKTSRELPDTNGSTEKSVGAEALGITRNSTTTLLGFSSAPKSLLGVGGKSPPTSRKFFVANTDPVLAE